MEQSEQNGFILGQHSAQLKALETSLTEVRLEQRETNAKLDRVLAVTERAKGSWKTLATIGGSLAVVIESLHQLAEWLRH